MENKNMVCREDWHTLKKEDIFTQLQTSERGLSQEEANERIKIYGENTLPHGKRTTILQIILHQLINPLIFILIVAAIASILIGDKKDAIFIFLVIFINTTIGAYQEYNAEKSAANLQKLMKIIARVRRDGKEKEVPAEQLVPGDIVLLESGMKVPADIYLIETHNLEIDESLLTGESIGVKKQTGILPEKTIVAERNNMAFTASTVIKGRGIGVVVCSGIKTQVGKISQDVIETKSAKPPLIQRMENFVKQITIFIVILGFFLTILLRLQGMDFISIVFFIVAMSVSAIPEGLPVALTVALSIATYRMAKRNVIVRQLTAVEGLGSCTVIASDKTGTLTVNEQTAKIILLPDETKFFVSGQGYNGEGYVTNGEGEKINFSENKEISEITRISIFANEASLTYENKKWEHHGDAIDVALLGMCYKLGVDLEKKNIDGKSAGKIPYESEHKFSATFYELNNVVYAGLKGAVETVIDFCSLVSIDGKVTNIDRSKILFQAESLAKEGYRVLAFAGGQLKNFIKKDEYDTADIPPLVFYGLVGFIDPLRSEAKDSVKKCYEAGIKVIMITGDHPETAGAIARELGIADKNTPVISGKMLAEAGSPDNPEFQNLVTSTTVFARISPTQKLQIVDVLIRKGEFVAVTGDGVNDAPALKRANIGVAMGSGTDVAKEVAPMIIIDDNFSSIVAGIEEGRFAYDNVRKVTYFLIATGAGLIFLVLGAVFAKLPLPLVPVQLLWLNLVTNGIQDVALAFEAGEPGVMKRRPRKPSEKIFNPLMITQTLIVGITIGLITFCFWWYLNKVAQIEEFHARNMLLLLMVFMQNIHVFNSRSERISAFKVPIKNNILLIFGVIAAQSVHIISMHIPVMQNVLRIKPVTLKEWITILLLAIPVLIVMEIFKIYNRKFKKF